ncbi:uncharacterized protein MONOS_13905 [Monocercomonoides exilis]|uniref:uncharacterized protein n=1 Tax=Monocercomonoides exilis TaxID=2049356 RepID=UPI003559FCF7|nr:hypothetical protein MONOS_13905 [Monocercomonoides exilis]
MFTPTIAISIGTAKIPPTSHSSHKVTIATERLNDHHQTTPFDGATYEEVFQNILQSDADFTAFPEEISKEVVSLIRLLLKKKPAKRLRTIDITANNIADEIKENNNSKGFLPVDVAGSKEDDAVMKHADCSGINWKSVHAEEPVFQPVIESEEDLTKFFENRDERFPILEETAAEMLQSKMNQCVGRNRKAQKQKRKKMNCGARGRRGRKVRRFVQSDTTDETTELMTTTEPEDCALSPFSPALLGN